MPTPRSELALQNVATTLRGITTGAGYSATVAVVEEVPRAWVPSQVSERPFIGLEVDDDDDPIRLLGGLERHRMSLSLHLILQAPAGQSAREALNRLHHDVKAALNVDTTRGSHPTITGDRNATYTDVGALEREHQSDGTQVYGRMPVTVVYHELATVNGA